MTYKTSLALLVGLLLASNAMAFGNSSGIKRDFAMNSLKEKTEKPDNKGSKSNATATKPTAVPELDGSMAVMALGLTLAVGGLIREKRRSR